MEKLFYLTEKEGETLQEAFNLLHEMGEATTADHDLESKIVQDFAKACASLKIVLEKYCEVEINCHCEGCTKTCGCRACLWPSAAKEETELFNCDGCDGTKCGNVCDSKSLEYDEDYNIYWDCEDRTDCFDCPYGH